MFHVSCVFCCKFSTSLCQYYLHSCIATLVTYLSHCFFSIYLLIPTKVSLVHSVLISISHTLAYKVSDKRNGSWIPQYNNMARTINKTTGSLCCHVAAISLQVKACNTLMSDKFMKNNFVCSG